MRFLVTGATGFLGWRATVVLAERGHEVVAVARPGARARVHARDLDAVVADVGDPAAQELVAGCDVVLHFAGQPAPSGARADPAQAVRDNAGTTLNLLEGCERHGAALVYPSSIRAAARPAPDPYAVSKGLGEEACRRHPARATIVRLTSVFGPGQVAWEGATGAIAAFAARALTGEPIVIPGDPMRARDFVYVDDAVGALEAVAAAGRWDETITLASGVPTPLLRAAELVVAAAGSGADIQTPGGSLPPGENDSYEAGADRWLGSSVRPLEEAVPLYVDWLRSHPAAQGRA
ncbi:MAG: UDP-glucose 4-epimerase [uncultured Solirubrobacteraceae bacterium]|uniref:UDP-glucose 4-epimerase n=1 Tax=uncultured Solirubrobacteraceae bacterium TaxID=1162706 RepID=A0A6J4ST37_9ACTN|nr:MAG: UDP-glucose 4-epimerase [uncultured Solirubrobacteraceae bacterium]